MSVLITGASGYLGRAVAERMPESQLILWHRDAPRVVDARREYVSGDLRYREPFDAVDPNEVTHIVHTAAVTRFDVDAAVAEAVNVAGTRKLARFAERCPRLESFTLVSTVYVAGLRQGEAPEAVQRTDAFANEYEASKYRAEGLLVDEFPHLPWRIVRTGTVLAHDSTGRVEQRNALHNTLKLLYHGLLSLVPGEGATPVALCRGDQAASAIVQATLSGTDHDVWQVCDSILLDAFVHTAFEAFGENADFAQRRVLPPLFCSWESFDRLRHETQGFGGDLLTGAMSTLAPFARQLFAPKDFRNENWVAAARPQPRDLRDLLGRVCRDLVDTQWGRQEHRHVA